ncbi:ABC-type cobalamin/Fe3+-siderophores transport system ATPase subunit [Microbacterium trichothecenolyticum]|uniref:PqqD family peptide modification chaperone n=1 Tax=Microbacterium trichothecenolyticum TaxID=69370 RepID=UPI0028606A30|nr:PqqD family peptide modification chaperone [Microbacterium trichothecenolyticum]MDR7184890.1 ABC-type cobalamin/Fe3+-siderophores transport system ATPase subunit [Microbacterium trichothecenolyticum]
MTGNLVIAALGVRVGIVCDGLDAESRAAVEEAWTDAATVGVADIEVAAESGGSIRSLLSSLSQRVTLAAIEAQRGRLWMLHAAGIALPDGRVVALVGPSGRGKTTASRVLGEAYGYVSDETVAVDSSGRVHPYRKPLSIIEPGESEKAQRSPSALGLGSLPDASLRLAGVVLLDRREDVSGAVVSDVDLGDALEELVAQSSYLTNLPAPLRTIAALVASVGGVRRVSYADAAALVSVLPELAAESPSRPRVSEPVSLGHSAIAGPPASRVFRRVAPLDELQLADPDRLALLHVDADHAGTVRVLAGIAPALWRAADGVDLEALVAAAVSAYGAPGDQDATVAVEAAVDELVAAGVLKVSSPAGSAGPALWRIHDDVAWTGESSRVVVLALANPAASPLALEGSAALIWIALAAGPGHSDDIVARVAASAEVDGDAIRDDVESFLGTLRDQDLVFTG